jgi:hypothetical protein
MKRQALTQPVAPLPTQQVQSLPCWHTLPPERQQSTIIALATMMVKWLPERRRPQGVDDA